jgi:hypothetical protein
VVLLLSLLKEGVSIVIFVLMKKLPINYCLSDRLALWKILLLLLFLLERWLYLFLSTGDLRDVERIKGW